MREIIPATTRSGYLRFAVVALVACFPALLLAEEAPPPPLAESEKPVVSREPPKDEVKKEKAMPKAEILPEGHVLPRRGEVVSEFREKTSGGPDAPETVIRLYEDEYGNQTREFIINGMVFQIQVTPLNGTPYLLIDNDGDGLFEARVNSGEAQLVIPQWVIFRF